MAAARQLRTPLQAATLETVLGLLAVSGLRVGEVIRCDTSDATLHVRNSKGGRSRIVALDRSFPKSCTDIFFVSTVGHRLSSGNLAFAFSTVVALAGLPPSSAGVEPRLGGFRHSFAVHTLLERHRARVDVAPRLPLLSSFLGHVNLSSTYWYYSDSRVIPIPASRRA